MVHVRTVLPFRVWVQESIHGQIKRNQNICRHQTVRQLCWNQGSWWLWCHSWSSVNTAWLCTSMQVVGVNFFPLLEKKVASISSALIWPKATLFVGSAGTYLWWMYPLWPCKKTSTLVFQIELDRLLNQMVTMKGEVDWPPQPLPVRTHYSR